MSPATPTVLTTERLTLRPFTLADAPAIQALCGNWDVARMLSVVPHPYPDGLAAEWIAGQATRRERGEDYAFAIEYEDRLIGAVSLEKRGDAHELGYWIGQDWWGRGLTSEAAARLVRYAFEALGLRRLTSGYFDENPGSGRVLEKCGFRVTGHGELKCVARGQTVPSTLVELVNPAAGTGGAQ
jgi:RimJ/RimL family protein N-acetyltransferase